LIEPRRAPPDGKRPLYVRLGWMLAIWAASVAALGVLAMVLRWWLS